MALKLPVSGGGEDFKRAPSGAHIAVCNLIADCGMQPGSNAFPKPKRKLYLRFELPQERVEYTIDGKTVEGPMTIGSFYTASMSEKATLRKHLESWRGKAFHDAEAAEFDVSKLLGVPCMLTVTEAEHNGKTYSNVTGIAPIPRGIPKPSAENDLVLFDPDHPQNYEALPAWLRKKVDEQIKPEPPAGNERHARTVAENWEDDDIPF